MKSREYGNRLAKFNYYFVGYNYDSYYLIQRFNRKYNYWWVIDTAATELDAVRIIKLRLKQIADSLTELLYYKSSIDIIKFRAITHEDI